MVLSISTPYVYFPFWILCPNFHMLSLFSLRHDFKKWFFEKFVLFLHDTFTVMLLEKRSDGCLLSKENCGNAGWEGRKQYLQDPYVGHENLAWLNFTFSITFGTQFSLECRLLCLCFSHQYNSTSLNWYKHGPILLWSDLNFRNC